MKFTVILPELQKLLQTAIQAIPPKSTLPILENFYLNVQGSSLTIVSTDQELTILSALNVEVVESGAVLIPARRLSDIVKALGNTGRITIAADPKTFIITLSTETGQYTLHGLHADEFPDVPDFSAETAITLSPDVLTTLARTGLFAASKDEYRPAMTGVLWQCASDRIQAVTTDGFRLVRLLLKTNTTFTDKTEVIIPVKVIDLLKKVEGDVQITMNPTHIKFVTPGTTVISRIIDEKFPPYESVIPSDNDKAARFAINELLASIRRIALFANQTSKQIRCALEHNTWKTVTEDAESGNKAHETISCDYDGPAFEIGFNYRYIEDALSHLSETGAKTGVITFSTSNKAALLKPVIDEAEDESVLMLVMPVRL